MVPPKPSRTLAMEAFKEINAAPVCTTRTRPLKGYYLESLLPERMVEKNSIGIIRNKN